ncbi:MAG: hypothetical protein J5817_06700 [Treponema sp.]|nr:hypothetical protein [Treponema sp.]
MNDIVERTQVMELVQTLPAEQVRYVLRVIQSLPRKETSSSRCNLRGRFASYANPELRAREKEAWALAVEEKQA